MNELLGKNEAFKLLEKEAPKAIIGAIECKGGVVIPLLDICNHPEALDMIDAQAKKEGCYQYRTKE